MLTVTLDGENAWSTYAEDGRPFLHALYDLLEHDTEILTVTFDEYLHGNPARGVAAHPVPTLVRVHALFTGSWIDQPGSGPGVDLGTWIGEPAQDRAWALLRTTRDHLDAMGATPASAPAAFAALYAAEGSDWFWWLGSAHDSGDDALWDDLFRSHLANVYRAIGRDVPPGVLAPLVPRSVRWAIDRPDATLQPGDRLLVHADAPGVLTWRTARRGPVEQPLDPTGGAMAGTEGYQVTLGPFSVDDQMVSFRVDSAGDARDPTIADHPGDEHTVRVTLRSTPAPPTPAATADERPPGGPR